MTLVTVRHRPVIVTPAEGPKAAYDAAVRAALERGGVVVPGGARGPPGQELGEGLSIGRPAGDAVSPNRGRFTIERAVLDPPVVFDAAGRRTNLKPADVVGRIEMFGQHELAEVARQKTSVAQMIEGFAGMPETSSGRQELLRKLADNRERLAGAEADQSRLEDELADILRLEATVEHYRASGLPGKLEGQKRLGQDGSIFSEAKTRLGIASAAVSELANSDVVAQLVQVYEGADDSPQAAVLQRVRAATTKLSEEISAAQTALTAAVRAASTEIEEANVAWQEVTTPQREKHAEVLRKLKADGHEPEKYLATANTLAQLKAKTPRLASVGRQLKRSGANVRHCLVSLMRTRRSDAGTWLAIRRANDATGGAVLVKPIPSPKRVT